MMVVMEKNREEQLKKDRAREEEMRKHSIIARITRAIQHLRDLGAREIEIRNGVKGLYIPGDVNVRNIMDVKTYGMYVAAKKRTHKHYLRHNKK